MTEPGISGFCARCTTDCSVQPSGHVHGVRLIKHGQHLLVAYAMIKRNNVSFHSQSFESTVPAQVLSKYSAFLKVVDLFGELFSYEMSFSLITQFQKSRSVF